MAGNSECYASTEDLAMLGLPSDTLSLVDDPTMQRHLEIATGTINSYLRSQYKLPIKADNTTGKFPPELVTACVHIAAYSLIQFIGYQPTNGDDKYERRYFDMVGNASVSGSTGWLDKVASGAVSLDIDVDDSSLLEGGPQVDTQPRRGWNLDNLGRANTKFI